MLQGPVVAVEGLPRGLPVPLGKKCWWVPACPGLVLMASGMCLCSHVLPPLPGGGGVGGGLAAPGPVLPVPPATLHDVTSWFLNLPVLSIIAPQRVELLHLFLFLWGFFEPQIFLQRKMPEAKI